ncbi:unnamed protein product [Ixodes hexagonus]
MYKAKKCSREKESPSMHAATKDSSTSPVDMQVLLQTFRAWLLNESQSCYIRGVFDNGSQITFIREDLSKKLGLRTVRTVDLSIKAFGGSNGAPRRKYNLVQAAVMSQFSHFQYELDAIEVPFICEELIEAPSTHSFVNRLTKEGRYIADLLLFLSWHQLSCGSGPDMEVPPERRLFAWRGQVPGGYKHEARLDLRRTRDISRRRFHRSWNTHLCSPNQRRRIGGLQHAPAILGARKHCNIGRFDELQPRQRSSPTIQQEYCL